MRCPKNLWGDEIGVIISAEMVLILTIVVIGVIVGLVHVRDAVVSELVDIGQAISCLNQSYGFTGFRGGMKRLGCGMKSWVSGSSFTDVHDATAVLTTGDFCQRPADAVCLPSVGKSCIDCVTTATYGTIVLSDRTLIPLTWVTSGTWSCPGGIVLAATSADATTLRLADGAEIPFLLGRAGTLLFESGKAVVVSPGPKGTLVLPDGAVAVVEPNDCTIAVLPDGTRATFRPLDPSLVLLPDGTTVKVEAAERSILILRDGRSLDLHDAIIPPINDPSSQVVPPAKVKEPLPIEEPPKSKQTDQ